MLLTLFRSRFYFSPTRHLARTTFVALLLLDPFSLVYDRKSLDNQKDLIAEARFVCECPYQAFPKLLIDEENVFRALFEVAHLGSGNPFCSRTRLFIMLCLGFCSFSETSFLV